MNRLAALLLVVAPVAAAGAQTVQLDRPALEDSLMSIQSSSARASALRRVAETTDRATLLTVMRVARTVPSSQDRAQLLEDIAPRYLVASDAMLSAAFFRAARTVPSSEDLSGLLVDVVPLVSKSADMTNAFIEVARLVPSSPERAHVLATLVTAGAVNRSDVRDNFGDAVLEIPSDRDRQVVLRATARSLKE